MENLIRKLRTYETLPLIGYVPHDSTKVYVVHVNIATRCRFSFG
jgi:hypothetical protein